MATEDDSYYLELCENPIRFEAVNHLTNVFFDDSNKHVFAVRSGGVMGVVVKGAYADDKPLSFRMEDRGPVLSIKFSLDLKVLAVQHCSFSVEFMNFNGTILDSEYSQSCKNNSSILGFVWTQNNEVAFITDHGIELYMVLADKKSLKHIRTMSITVQWFIWCVQNKLALLASVHGSQLQPIMFKPGSLNKLSKVEKPGRMALERDVTLSTLYGAPAVLILRHQSGPQSAEVHVHTFTGPGKAPIKAHVLKLGLSGRFAINVVDDLILVHHQASRSSQVFDISLLGETDGSVQYHGSISPAKSFKPAYITLPGLAAHQSHSCELYSPNWVVFQPNIVIDVKLGCLWHISLRLKELCNAIRDLSICTKVLLKRTDGKQILLEQIYNEIKKEIPQLEQHEESFNHINNVYREYLKAEIQMHSASGVNERSSFKPRVLIDQQTIYNDLLQKLEAEHDLEKLEWTLISYMTSLHEHGISAQPNLNELMVTTLVKRKKFTALQQMLQYGVLVDSKPLACLLLSLGNLDPATTQLALDMLTRLNAYDEIFEILFSEKQVISAVRLNQNSANLRKFLEAAKNTGDDVMLHSTLYYCSNNIEFVNAFQC